MTQGKVLFFRIFLLTTFLFSFIMAYPLSVFIGSRMGSFLIKIRCAAGVVAPATRSTATVKVWQRWFLLYHNTHRYCVLLNNRDQHPYGTDCPNPTRFVTPISPFLTLLLMKRFSSFSLWQCFAMNKSKKKRGRIRWPLSAIIKSHSLGRVVYGYHAR